MIQGVLNKKKEAEAAPTNDHRPNSGMREGGDYARRGK